MRKALLLALTLTTTLLSASVMAETINSLRCEHGFARLGVDKFLVKENCGQPLDAEITSSPRAEKRTERLVYRQGRQTFFMHFESGRLKSIVRHMQ